MSQINFPTAISSQVELFENWTTHHGLLGVNSPLNAKIADDGIDLVKLTTQKNAAVTNEGFRLVYEDKAHTARQAYNSHIVFVTDFEKKFAQFLKRHYSKNPLQCTDWGYDMTVGGKFNHPKDYDGIKGLLKKIDDKHKALAAKSPLLAFLAVNPEYVYADILKHSADAQTNVNDINDADKKVGEYATLRDEAIVFINNINKEIGNYLMSIYVGKAKLVRNFGYDVSDAGAKIIERSLKILPTEEKHAVGVVKGSAFVNTGKCDLHIYKGKSTKGSPNIVKPNEELGMNKGFSVITIVNPSSLITGTYKVTVSAQS